MAEKPGPGGAFGRPCVALAELAPAVGAAAAVTVFSSDSPDEVVKALSTAVEAASEGGDRTADFAPDSGAAGADAAVGAGRASAALCTMSVAGVVAAGAVIELVLSRASSGISSSGALSATTLFLEDCVSKEMPVAISAPIRNDARQR